MVDILIRNGWVADGTGNPAIPADVAIERDRIAAVGRLDGCTAGRVIDARGKIVCPGFVDCHSHSDTTILRNPLAHSTIRQGITTEIVGNCGDSPAPLTSMNRRGSDLLGVGGTESPAWSTFGELLTIVAETRVSPNLAWFVGHNTLRSAAGAYGSQITAEQRAAMQRMLLEALDAGALGLSTGLEFDPGRSATTEEIDDLAAIVGSRDRYYASHIRNRAKHLLPAIDEFIGIVARSGARGQVSHLNVRYNTGAPDGAWECAVAAIEEARGQGFDIQTDCTPYVDGGGNPAAILPLWVTEEGPQRAADLLADPAVRATLRTDCDRYWAFIQRGDWHRVRIAGSSHHPEIVGLTFCEIADVWRRDPWDCLFDLLSESFRGEGSTSYIGQLFTEEHVAEYIRHPLFSLAVDATTVATEGPLRHLYAHPLPFAGMVHYLTYWVRKKGVLRLEEAIRKMTSMPAARFGLQARGLLRSGAFADVVVFDYAGLEDGATLENPVVYCKGVEFVLVNGEVVVDGGQHTGARPGQVLTYA